MSKELMGITPAPVIEASKNSEVELLRQKLAEKDALIASFMKTETHLVPLPNGDLHRGFRQISPVLSNIDVEIIPDTMGNPLDRAMAKILSAAKGGHELTCLWCGLQFNQGGEKGIREHLKDSHPSVVDGWEKQENMVLMANLAEAQARLASSK